MKCPQCPHEVDEGDRFCQECGVKLTPTIAEPPADLEKQDASEREVRKMDGKSRIELDKETVNILLHEFVNRDGTEVAYEGGNFHLKRPGLELSLRELPLADTQLDLKAKAGLVKIAVSKFELEDSKISVDLDVGLS